VSAGAAVLTAVTGMATASDPLETALGHLEATTTSGGVFVTNTGHLTIGLIGP